MKHFTNKVFGTFKICFTMFMARTFGTYVHSGWDRDLNMDYAKYIWKGKEYIIPTQVLSEG